jgi:hypothetical protein
MTLPIIRSGGIEAYCSDLVTGENSWVYLLSVAGYQTAVKGCLSCAGRKCFIGKGTVF